MNGQNFIVAPNQGLLLRLLPYRDYTVRCQSNVWRLPKYWPPSLHPPQRPASVYPPPHPAYGAGGGHTRWVERGVGGQYFGRRQTYVSTLWLFLLIRAHFLWQHSAEKHHVLWDLNFRFALQEAGKWILAGRVETEPEPGRWQQGEGGAGNDETKFWGYTKIFGKVRENTKLEFPQNFHTIYSTKTFSQLLLESRPGVCAI